MILIICFFLSLGIPQAGDIIGLPAQTEEVEVVIKWNEPQNNGARITQYIVYQRTVSDDGIASPWQKVKVISDVSVRRVAVQLERGKTYEFVVTARNKFGESFKGEEMVKRTNVLSGKCSLQNSNRFHLVLYAVAQRGISEANY